MNNRPRRLRGNAMVRNMVRETRVDASSLIYPIFVVEGENLKEGIPFHARDSIAIVSTFCRGH